MAGELRRLLNAPMVEHFPEDTRTVLISPDAALTRLPWAAIPGKKKGTVFIEDYALAVVPYGPFLLDQLIHGKPAQQPESQQNFPAVGGVKYDQQHAAVQRAKDRFKESALHSAASEGGKIHWK